MGLREHKKRETERKIIDCAAELFEKHGYEATTIEMIAEASVISPRTVYRYFERKEDIVFATADEAIERIVDHLATTYESGVGLSGMIDAFADHIVEIQKDPVFATRTRLIYQTPALADNAAIWRHNAADRLAQELAQRDGSETPTLEHHIIGHSVISMWTAARIDWTQNDQTDDLAQLISRAARIARTKWTATEGEGSAPSA